MIDVLIDLQYGDCGKGRTSKYLNKINSYDIIAKYNGGGNAGHSVFIGDKEYIAHYLTSAVYDKDAEILIGPGCVLNVKEFLKEVETFKDFDIENRVFIHPFVHIITDEHIAQDDLDNKIGSTKKGIGPAYAGKYARTNKRAMDIPELEKFVSPALEGLWHLDMLMEGSQGWGLDIDWGNYPYVTSSHIHPGFAFATFGIPLSKVGTIYGVCKPYLTYVGSSEDIVYCSEEDAEIIRKIGNEYGRTTGRPRKIGYLDLSQLTTAIQQTGVTKLFINKCDVLEQANIFKMRDTLNEILFSEIGKVVPFASMKEFKEEIEYKIFYSTEVDTIYYGHSPDSNSNYIEVKKKV